jgi:hypothetical protein
MDAVMAWENLVGTRSEVTFRVTAALAKLLESDRGKRGDLRRELGKLYDLRSRVMHGDVAEPSEIHRGASRATQVALAALRESYRRGPSWLSMKSNERADQLILEEP